MKCIRLAAAAAFLALAACSPSATEPTSAVADRPSFDGGNSLGSGNYMGEDGGGMIGSGNDAGVSGEVLSDSTATTDESGGNGMGSGT